METDTAKAHAANKDSPLLLLYLEGERRFWGVITTGVQRTESTKRRNQGIYETMPSTPSKKIILNNDNDDRRKLFETCALKAKRVCNPIIDLDGRGRVGYIRSEILL